MNPTASFLNDLKTTAETARTTEASFRRQAANQIAVLEQERAFAFRRLNLMQDISDAVASAESEEIAVASALAVLRLRLGWNADSEARTEAITHFGPVALALFQAAKLPDDEPATNIGETLAIFEHWYSESRGSPFWLLFEHQIVDTPLVDF